MGAWFLSYENVKTNYNELWYNGSKLEVYATASSILLVEDDLYLSQGLTELLQKSGYVPCQAWNLSQARQSVYSRNFDLLILDVTLPDGDGISFCRELRASGCATPIFFLTARDEEFDIVTGLDAGGNDYVTKPFRVQELLSRIRVLLRKDSPNLTRGKLEIDQARMQVLRQGVALPLTLTEYKILLCLIRQRGVATRDILLGALWDSDGKFVDDNTLSVHISRLREKIGGQHIQTVRGVGYQWVD